MKTSKIILSVASVFIATAVCITSCKKKDTPPEDKDTAAASDNNLAESTSSDVNRMVANTSEIAVGDSLNVFRYLGEESLVTSCALVTRDTVNKIITVTFNGQACYDGRIRSGTLTFNFSSSTNGARFYRNPGFRCVISSNNYVVDGNQVSISKTITNTTNPSFDYHTTNMTWSITSNVSIVKSGGGTVTWNATRIRTLLNTSDPNVYHGQLIPISWQIAKVGNTGSASGITAAGENYTLNITNQLVRDMTCSPDASRPGRHPFIQGTLDFTPGSRATRHIDYGNGACDFTFTVTINGVTYTING